MYEGTICWRLDESTQGYAAGGGAFGQAPDRAERGSQAPDDDHQVVQRTGLAAQVAQAAHQALETPTWPLCSEAGRSHPDGQQTGSYDEWQDRLPIRRRRLLHP